MTSRTSAPTASHSPATALTKLSLVARKAFEAYLMVSAVAASVIKRGACGPAPREHGHLGRVGVTAGHAVAEIGPGRRGRQPHVADADDRHRASLPVGEHPHRGPAAAEWGADRDRYL